MTIRRDWQILVLLAAATIAVFWQVSWHGFVNFDDPAYVTYNPVVREGLTWPGVVWAFTNLHGEATYWHPVTWLSHMLDCQLFGLKPAGHHLTSLFLHTINTLLLFVVLRGMTGRRGASAMVAALFALHPLQVESVAWISERKNVLSTFFFMLTLFAYGRYAEVRSPKSKIQNPKSQGRPEPEDGEQIADSPTPHHVSRFTFQVSRITFHASLFYLLSFLCFAFGLMSKPTLVPLPFLLLLLDYWPLRRLSFPSLLHSTAPLLQPSPTPLLRLIGEKLPFLVLSGFSSVLTIQAHSSLGGLVSTEQLPISLRLANAPVACALYLRKLVWPVDLSVFYLHPGKWPADAVVASTLLVLAMTAAAFWQARRRPYLIVGWLWFLGMLVPVIGLVQANVQALADRFAYVPAIGFFIIVVWAAAEWFEHRRQRSADLQSAFPRISNPHRPQTNRLTRRLPTGDRANANSASPSGWLLGYDCLALAALVLVGCLVMTSLQLRHWQNSVTLLQRVVQVEPGSYLARVMLGNAFFERRQLDDAQRQYEAAVRLRPDDPDGWVRAGVVLIEQDRPAEAMPYLRRAVELAPGWPEAQRRLALAWLRQGRIKEAQDAYQTLAAMMPATAEAQRDLADMLAEGQQFAQAVSCYHEAIRLKPNFEAALNNLAMLHASCPQPEFRNGAEAVRLAETACRLSGRRNPSFLGTLAAAYAEAGRFDDAVKTIQEALAVSNASGADDLVPIQSRMQELFRAGKPFR